MTASGKPLLANDPHLGAQIPSLWYLAHLSAGDFDVIGATLPGAPAVAIGRNRFIAWGETNVMADVQDLFRERLDPTGTHGRIPRRAGTAADHHGDDRRQGRRAASASTCASRATARSSRTPSTPTTPRPPRAEQPAPIEPLAFRWTALDREDATIRRVPLA